MSRVLELTAKGGAVAFGNISVALSSLIVASLLIGKFGLAGYGEFVIFQTVLTVCLVAMRVSTWQATVRYGEYGLPSIYRFALTLELLSAISLWGLGCVIYVIFVNEEASLSLDWLYLSLFAMFINSSSVTGYLRYSERHGLVSLIQSVSAIAKVLIAAAIEERIEVVFYIMVIVEGAIWFVSVFILTLKDFSTKIVKFPKEGFIWFSIWSTLNGLIDLPVQQFDRLILATLMGAETVGAYNLIKRLASIVNQIGDPIYQLFFPLYSKWIKEGLISEVKRTSLIMTYTFMLLSVPVAVVGYLAFDSVNRILFSSGLSVYKNEFTAFLFVQMLALTFTWVHSAHLAFGMVRRGAVYLFVANLVYVILITILAPDYALMGVVSGLLAQYLLVVIPKIYDLKLIGLFSGGSR